MIDDLQNILIKARELYMKYGIKSITMDDVARELSISKKTLYQYVADKDDLVGKVFENEIRIRQEEICNCFKEGFNAIEELFEISIFMNKMVRKQSQAAEYDLRKYYPHHYQKILNARRQGMYSYILLNLRKGKEEKLYREDMDEEIIAKLYLARVENIYMNELITVEEFTSFKLFAELLTYHIRGIATKEGIVILEEKLKGLDTSNI